MHDASSFIFMYSVCLMKSKLSPALLKCIATTKGLKSLTIERCTMNCKRSVVTEFCALLPHLHSLESIRICRSGLSESKIISSICSLQTLRQVEIQAVGDISPLTQLGRLETLSLSRGGPFGSFTDDDFEVIGSISTLSRLSVQPCWDSHNGMHHLANLTNLEHLLLHRIRVCEDDIMALGSLTKLKSLRLAALLLANDISALQALPLERVILQVINGCNCKIADQLGGITTLKSVSLGETGHAELWDNADSFAQPLNGLLNLSNLQSMSIYSKVVTNRFVNLLCNNQWQHLEEVALYDCSNITESCISHFSKIKSLKRLTLQKFHSLKATSGLKKLARLDNIEVLKLYACENLKVASLKPLASMESLRTLFVHPYFLSRWESHIPENMTFLNKRQINEKMCSSLVL